MTHTTVGIVASQSAPQRSRGVASPGRITTLFHTAYRSTTIPGTVMIAPRVAFMSVACHTTEESENMTEPAWANATKTVPTTILCRVAFATRERKPMTIMGKSGA